MTAAGHPPRLGRPRRAAALVLMLLAGGAGLAPVGADERPGAWLACHAEAPPDRVVISARALARLRASVAGETGREEGQEAAQHLRLLGAAGRRVTACALAEAAHRLPAADARAWAWIRALLAVLADDRAPAIDEILEAALRWPDGASRAMAADGLGQLRPREDAQEARVIAALAACATDPFASVRWSALRSLVALPGARAESTRAAWPDAPDVQHEGVRLRWHRRAGDRGPLVMARALRLWQEGVSLDVRLEAAELLAQHDAPTDAALLVALIDTLEAPAEPGAETAGAAWQRSAVRRRRISIEATLSWWTRAGDGPEVAVERERVLERAIEWTARPVSADPRGREPQPEQRLWRWLPDAGPMVVAPVMRRLRSQAFHEPRKGVLLLTAQPRAVALASLHELIRFALERLPEAAGLLSACTGGLVDLGRVEDEALATTLFLDPRLERWTRDDLVRVLRSDPGTWVMPLLERALAQGDKALRMEALRALEGRREEQAYALQVEAFFADPHDRGHDRLAALVERGDERALAVLDRALGDVRQDVLLLGLQQVNPRARRLHTTAVLERIRPLGARVREPRMVQAYLYALLILAPGEAVEWVARQWDAFTEDAIRVNSLRILQEARGEVAGQAAVDLALAVQHRGQGMRGLDVAIASVLRNRWGYRHDDVVAFWRRLLAPGQPLRATAVDAVAQRGAPDLSDVLLPYLAELRPPPRDMDGESAVFLRIRILDALRYQPWERVGATLVEVALDPHATLEERTAAIHGMAGRLTPDARWRVMHWLGWPLPPGASAGDVGGEPAGAGAKDDPDMHWQLAVAVGRGGGAAVADALLRALDQELEAWLAAQPPARAGVETRYAARLAQGEAEQRIRALARGVAVTEVPEAVAALLGRVLDGRLGRVAAARLAGLRPLLSEGRGEPLSPRPLGVVREQGSSLSYDLRLEEGWPHPAAELLGQVKVLGDERLAVLMAEVVDAALLDGGLAGCPDAYLTMAVANLLYAPTGRRPLTARLVLDVLERLAPGEAGTTRVAETQWQNALITGRRFGPALEVERDDVHRLLHRQMEEPEGDPITWGRFHVLALEGAVAATPEAARRLYAQALAVAPDRSDHLNSVAWYLRETGGDLDEAERLIRRAMRLEERKDTFASLAATDTLAMILLDRGEAVRAARLLEDRIHEADKDRTGIFHLHLAEIEAACGNGRAAWMWMVEALRRDPASAAMWHTLPWVVALEAAQPGWAAALETAEDDAYFER